jgi:CubicO group peptidase (beta-lactamase class C family)
MDLTQLDALTKALSTPTSRRQALKALTATAAGGTLGLSGIGPVLATRQDQRPPIVGHHDARPEGPMMTSAGAVTRAQVEAALPKLETLATETLRRTGVPGLAITVVYKDEVLFLRGFGVGKAGTARPVTADTVFQLASVSKPIASTIVAGLVGDKVVTWDDPIVKHDPAFQMDDPYVTRAVTLRDMFCHRSGLPDHAGDLLEDMGFDRATILHRLRYLPTGNRFRATYAYTNFGLTAAAVAAARAAGTSWHDLAAARLYRRLGMTHTSSRVADFTAAPNRALLHVRVGGRWVARYTRDPDTESPAGGVSSSVRDLAQWLRLQLGNGMFEGRRVIDAAALAETHRPQIISDAPHNPATDRAGFYGLGWNVSYDDQGRVRLSHSGAFNLGAATTVTLLPSEQLGIVALTNAHPIGAPEALTRSFLDLVLTGTVAQDWLALYGQRFLAFDKPAYGTTVDYTRPPAHPSPALASTAYVGVYHSNFFGEITIAAHGGGLVLTQGPHKAPFPLRHFARNVFTYQPVGENAYGLSAVTFTVGAEGKATRVVVENLDIHGQGTFTRVAHPV